MKKRSPLKISLILILLILIACEFFLVRMDTNKEDCYALQSYADNVRTYIYLDYFENNERKVYKGICDALESIPDENFHYELLQGGRQIGGVLSVEDANNLYEVIVPVGIEECSDFIQSWINADAWKNIEAQCESDSYQVKYYCLRQVLLYETSLVFSPKYRIYSNMFDYKCAFWLLIAMIVFVLLICLWTAGIDYFKLEEEEDENECDRHDEVDTGCERVLPLAGERCGDEEPEASGDEGACSKGQCECNSECSCHCVKNAYNQRGSGLDPSFAQYVEEAALHRMRNE